MFSAKTADLLKSVELRGSRAIVDLGNFPALIPNVGTSNVSAEFQWQLDLTVFQFPNIESIRYELNGSCRAFFRALESNCHVIRRSDRLM